MSDSILGTYCLQSTYVFNFSTLINFLKCSIFFFFKEIYFLLTFHTSLVIPWRNEKNTRIISNLWSFEVEGNKTKFPVVMIHFFIKLLWKIWTKINRLLCSFWKNHVSFDWFFCVSSKYPCTTDSHWLLSNTNYVLHN